MNGGVSTLAGRFDFRGSVTAAKDFVELSVCAFRVTLALLAEFSVTTQASIRGHFGVIF